jgi:hypothetical protein
MTKAPLWTVPYFSGVSSRLSGRLASIPLAGEEKKKGKAEQRHDCSGE